MTFGPGGLPHVFRVDGEPYVFTDVGGWFVAGRAASGDWWALIPGSLDEPSQRRLWARLGDPRDRLDLVWLHHIASTVLGEVCGAPWHAVCRMLAAAHEHWLLFDGWCVTRGFDPQQAAPHRVVSAAYAWLRSSCSDEKEWGRLEWMLFEPPAPPRRAAGGGGVPMWGGDEEARLFQQALSTLG